MDTISMKGLERDVDFLIELENQVSYFWNFGIEAVQAIIHVDPPNFLYHNKG